MILDRIDQDKESKIDALLYELTGHEFFNSDYEKFKKWISPLIYKIKKRSLKIITVAGSNGKGQVAFTLAHYLQENNRLFSLWTSPHISSVRERFFSHQGFISEEFLLQKLDKVKLSPATDYKPSYYELLFSIFLEWSIEQEVDYLVLEVGLGGRLDAVNVLDCDIAAITSISREHSAILGATYKQILMEKLAVSREGKKLLTTLPSVYLRALTARFSSQFNIDWTDLFIEDRSFTKYNYFQRNEALAKRIASVLDLDTSIAPRNLGSGRFEHVYWRGNRLLFVGAHNLDGVRELAKIESIHADLALIAFSQRERKEIEQICKILSKIESINRVIITCYDHPKSASKEMVKDVANNLGILFVEDWVSYVKSLDKCSFLISGSYYFIGQIKRELKL